MSNEESLNHLEESIIINSSQIAPVNKLKSPISSFTGSNTVSIPASSSSGGISIDFDDIKKQMNPNLMNELT